MDSLEHLFASRPRTDHLAYEAGDVVSAHITIEEILNEGPNTLVELTRSIGKLGARRVSELGCASRPV